MDNVYNSWISAQLAQDVSYNNWPWGINSITYVKHFEYSTEAIYTDDNPSSNCEGQSINVPYSYFEEITASTNSTSLSTSKNYKLYPQINYKKINEVNGDEFPEEAYFAPLGSIGLD